MITIMRIGIRNNKTVIGRFRITDSIVVGCVETAEYDLRDASEQARMRADWPEIDNMTVGKR